jgi:CheY-like chemotaxis protein
MSSILLVSQDGDLRAIASHVLRKAGWQVTAVAHGGHALIACAGGRRFDIVVVDERAHADSAAAVERQLRRDCPEIRTVCLRDQRAAAADGRIAIVRPFTADDLIGAVRTAATASPSV